MNNPSKDVNVPSKGNDFGASVEDVLRDELQEIDVSRDQRLSPVAGEEPTAVAAATRKTSTGGSADIRRQASDRKLIGLAFSGGGIRSATFNLGVLQALSQMRLLRFIDYLSTVSGGGYIGSWLLAWTRPEQSIGAVEEKLAAGGKKCPTSEELPAVGFLRKFSNYLTPRVGLFSSDSWAMVTTYLRNLSLNLFILLLSVSVVICLPLLFVWLLKSVSILHATLHDLLFGASIVFLGTGLLFITMNLACCGTVTSNDPWFTRRPSVLFLIVMPVILSAVVGSFWFWKYSKTIIQNKWSYALAVLILYFVSWTIGQLFAKSAAGTPGGSMPVSQSWMKSATLAVGNTLRAAVTDLRSIPPLKARTYFYAVIISLAMGSLLISGLSSIFSFFGEGESAEWYVAIFGTPLFILFYMAVVTIQIGIMGRGMTDESREWWSRLGGWFFMFLVVWTGLFGLVIFGIPAVAWIGKSGAAAAGIGWLATSVSGLLAGKSSLTGGKGSKQYLEIIAKVAPYVFVIGLILLTSSLLCATVISLSSLSVTWSSMWDILWHQNPSFSDLTNANIYLMGSIFDEAHKLWDARSVPYFILFALACLIGAIAFSWRFDINQFSIHLLYRNRLIRCYLGATNERRRPQPVTGFDPQDDFPLSALDQAKGGTYSGPYPIINTTINLVGGKKLAWQQRKAASFVLTPKFCGCDLSMVASSGPKTGGYRPTNQYGGDEGMLIGEAVAISGAAASPNMGYHSSAPLSFLMTIFNVRLGWWCGNTRYEGAWKKPSPNWSLRYLIKELFGMTNDTSRYVYLSDGGHFENLGLYELVRRRCRLIIVSDASCDHEMKFDDLGNAIRKIRIDFGIPVEIDLSPLKEKNKRCALGTIHYKSVDGDEVENGILIYLKPVICGDEPVDVSNYKARNDTFPHQSTADQWFDEPQFESYRMLGLHSLQAVLGGKCQGKSPIELVPMVSDYLSRPEPAQAKAKEGR
ncbi:MAG: patatin-like phospholipase family protein [Nitrospirae bacterium]|nr:patatin-like phospholipase family protein [Nitrospirota bacterium]